MFWMQIINTEDVVKEKSQLFFLRLDGWRKRSRNHWSYNSGLIILGSVEDSVLWCSLFCSCVLTSELHPSLLSPWLSLLALSVQGPFPLLFHAFFRDWTLSRETASGARWAPPLRCWDVFLSHWCGRRHRATSTPRCLLCSLLFLPCLIFSHSDFSLGTENTPACCVHTHAQACVCLCEGRCTSQSVYRCLCTTILQVIDWVN